MRKRENRLTSLQYENFSLATYVISAMLAEKAKKSNSLVQMR